MPAEGLSFEFGGLHPGKDAQYDDFLNNDPESSAFSRTVHHYGPTGLISSICFEYCPYWGAYHYSS